MVIDSVVGRRVVVGVVILLLAWLAVTVEPAAITNDGPQHLWAAFADVHDLPGYAKNAPPTSNGAHQLLWVAMTLGVAPSTSLAFVTWFATACFMLAFSALCLRLHPDRWPLALLAGAVAHQFALQAGLLPWMLALSSTFFVIGHALRSTSSTRRGQLLTSLALLCTAWLHVVAAVVCGFVVAVATALRAADVAGRLRAIAIVVVVGAPAAMVALMATALPTAAVGVAASPFQPSLRGLIGAVLPQAPAADVVVIAVALAAGLFTVVRRRDVASLALAVTGLVLVLFAIAISPDALNWQLMRERVFAAGILLWLPLVPCEAWSQKGRVVVAAVCAVISIAVIHATRVDDRRIAAVAAPVLAATVQLPTQTGSWNALVTRLPGGLAGGGAAFARPGLSAWLHIGQQTATDVRGRPTFSHDDTPGIPHIINPAAAVDGITQAPSAVRWPQLWAATGPERTRLVTAYAAWGAIGGGYVGYGPPDELPIFVAEGHEVTATTPIDVDGNVAFATTFHGCDVDVVFAVDSVVDDVVEVGFFPANEPLATFPVASGRRVAHLHGVPCGSGLWWRRHNLQCVGSRGRVALPPPGGQASIAVSCVAAPVP